MVKLDGQPVTSAPSSLPSWGTWHRAYVLNDEDQRGLIVIAATLFMSWMILTFFMRILTRYKLAGSFGIDDLFAAAGSVLGIGNVISVMRSVHYGVGKSGHLISQESLVKAGKAYYACDLLFILGLVCSKVSIAFLLKRLGCRTLWPGLCYANLGVVSCWGIASFIIVAVRCSKDPWTRGEVFCADPTPTWIQFTVYDIVTEVLLMAMLAFLIWGLQMSVKHKLVVMTSFTTRLPIIILSALRLKYILTTQQGEDPTLNLSKVAITTEVLLHYSLMGATLPCLKPFLLEFYTGWGYGYPTEDRSNMSSSNPTSSQTRPAFRKDGVASSGTAGVERSLNRYLNPFDNSDARRGSDDQRLIIQQTVGWKVESIELHDQSRSNTKDIRKA